MKSAQKGTVKSITDGTAQVLATDAGMCGSCSTCGACGSGKKQLTYDVKVPAIVSEGQTISFEVETPNLAVLSFLMFGMPLFLVIMGGWVATLLFSGDDLVMVGGGVAGLLVGFALLAVIDRTVPALRNQTTYLHGVDDAPMSSTACESDGTATGGGC